MIAPDYIRMLEEPLTNALRYIEARIKSYQYK